MTEDFFRADFERFGSVDTVKVLPDKKVAFVHFTSINFAIKAVAQLRTEERFKGHKIDYGRDRSNRMPRRAGGGPPPGSVTPMVDIPDANAPAYRTVYLGNMDPDTTPDELCAIVRGGQIDSIKMIPDKQHAFVAFVTADGAATFYAACSANAPVVRGRTLKVGWGKESPLPSEVAMLVRQGATRNVYVGQIDDLVTPERLRVDFAPFGTLESVAIVREKKCAFVAFLSIQAAAKAIQALKNDQAYAHFKLNYGKDNCARQPRSSGSSNGQAHSSGPNANGNTSHSNSNGYGNGSAYGQSFSPPIPSLGSGGNAPANGTSSGGSPNGLSLSLSSSENGMFGSSFYYQPEPSPTYQSQYMNASMYSSSPPSHSSSPSSMTGGPSSNTPTYSFAQQPSQSSQPPLHQPQPVRALSQQMANHSISPLVQPSGSAASNQYGASAFSTGLFGSSAPSPSALPSPGGYSPSGTPLGSSSSPFFGSYGGQASNGTFSGFSNSYSTTPLSSAINGEHSSAASSKSSSPAPGSNGSGYGASFPSYGQFSQAFDSGASSPTGATEPSGFGLGVPVLSALGSLSSQSSAFASYGSGSYNTYY